MSCTYGKSTLYGKLSISGWLIITYAQDGDMILVGRAVCGAASAVGLPAAYTYVAEIASRWT